MTALAFFTELLAGKPADHPAYVWAKGDRARYPLGAEDAASTVPRLGANPYVGCAFLPPGTSKNIPRGKRPAVEHAAGIYGLWLDLDVIGAPDGKGGVKTTSAPDVAAALELAGRIAPPTLLVNSGGGIHAWWLFLEPWVFDGNGDRARAAGISAQWQQAHRDLVAWKIDGTHDLARVLRIPGTLNTKGDPPAPVELLRADGPRHELAELAAKVAHVKASGAGTGEYKPPADGERIPHGERHDHLKDFAVRLAKGGIVDYPAVLTALRGEFERACDPDPEPEPGSLEALARWGVRTNIADRERKRADSNGWDWAQPRTDEHGEVGADDLTVPVIDTLAKYQHMEDTDHVRVTLAVATTARLGDEPLWLQIVANASSGKSEDIRMLDDVTAGRMVEFTMPGLLGWTGGQKGHPTGLLSRIGDGRHLATITDFSTVIADSDRGRRDQLFALLRTLYDGHIHRDLGSAPKPLEWEGRLTIVSGVTPHIDNFSAHADALGPRWMYIRIPELSREGRRKAAALARRWSSRKQQVRAEVRDVATRAVQAGQARVEHVEVDDDASDDIIDGAMLCCVGRASVPRDGYGKREISGEVSQEEPPRLAGMLTLLYRGLVAVGVPVAEARRIMLRAAVDSMPLSRRKVLEVLADGEVLTTSEVARRADCDRKVARFALEELELLRVVTNDAPDEESDVRGLRGRRYEWRLTGEDGKLAADILKRVGRKVGYIPTSPPIGGYPPNTSSHSPDRGETPGAAGDEARR